MNCDECGRPFVNRKATGDKPYHYTLSGLRNIYLANIEVLRCEHCDLETPVIPRARELHRQIAVRLVHKRAPLKGAELRFLRKNVGLTGKDFARLIGVDPSHLSRVENAPGRSLGTSADRLARIAANADDAEHPRDMLIKIVHDLEPSPKARPGRTKPVFRLVKNHWEAPRKTA